MTTNEKTYKVIRMFANTDLSSKVVKRHLTLEQAQAWCKDPETSSRTCTSKKAKNLTARCGAWFDGYSEE